ncbi:hypothetical protein GHT09_007562 [Marmota monax]|uniref:Uncharacterized protein n=1 Tax=Marmota monax TaxID=9995 RepID=A0A834UM49_MARMO|nr:hypothetical protein GHT09_007562 [Marmota monax]
MGGERGGIQYECMSIELLGGRRGLVIASCPQQYADPVEACPGGVACQGCGEAAEPEHSWMSSGGPGWESSPGATPCDPSHLLPAPMSLFIPSANYHEHLFGELWGREESAVNFEQWREASQKPNLVVRFSWNPGVALGSGRGCRTQGPEESSISSSRSPGRGAGQSRRAQEPSEGLRACGGRDEEEPGESGAWPGACPARGCSLVTHSSSGGCFHGRPWPWSAVRGWEGAEGAFLESPEELLRGRRSPDCWCLFAGCYRVPTACLSGGGCLTVPRTVAAGASRFCKRDTYALRPLSCSEGCRGGPQLPGHLHVRGRLLLTHLESHLGFHQHHPQQPAQAMEAPEVPVGSLVDFGTEPPTAPPLEAAPSTLQDGDGSLGDAASESETTESADSENDMGESPSHPSWDQDRRSSSNESFSSGQSAESAQDEDALALREFMRGYVEKVFSGGEDLDQEEKAKFGEYCSSQDGKGREWFARYVSAQCSVLPKRIYPR